jgi:hypothetical protein
MYFTAQLRSPHGDCNCCRSGVGPCDGSTGPGDCGKNDASNPTFMNQSNEKRLGLGDSDPSWMSWTKVKTQSNTYETNTTKQTQSNRYHKYAVV